MPNWSDVLKELQEISSNTAPLDVVRDKYLHKLYEKTNRNVIAYYSGWLHKTNDNINTGITDLDQNAFMTTIHKLDKSKGLDLILHTPGGNLTATQSIVFYLKEIFGSNIRVIVPHLAMSAGTMMACAAKEIIMGKHSSLGPIDPQFNGLSTWGVLEEFEKAKEEIKREPSCIPLWQMIINKYHPTFLGDCEKSKTLAEEIVKQWLKEGMFVDDPNKDMKVNQICDFLSDHSKSKTHSRHFSYIDLRNIGLNIKLLEEDDELQDLVLTIHHSFMHTFSNTNAFKIVQNHNNQKIISVSNIK
ncbi:SDH family Clp fold serine proteinase [Candidatus Ruminimicrobium bovinum]|uniref:SDH family Clp fold serine proteinase n=1 Tax=Candidatus Ruminimicrobium bovinum TaxID=3242779 RepID=UPI0039B89A0A